MELLQGLGINIGYLLVQIGSFLIAFLLLRAWVFKPLMKSVEDRKTKIEEGLENARVAEYARENAEAEAEMILEEARTKALRETMSISRNVEMQAQDIVAEAETKAKQIIFDAEQTAIKEKKIILGEARQDMINIATAMSYKVIGETLNVKKQRKFMHDFFTGLQEVKAKEFGIFDKHAKEVQVYTALPLLEDENDEIIKMIRSYFTDNSKIVFKVRPIILGGIIIKADGKILDASVASQMSEIKKALV